MRKRCTRCDFECLLAVAEAFFYARNRKDGFGDGLQPCCKECDKKRVRAYLASRPVQRREYARNYYAGVMADPERAAVRRAQGREHARRKRNSQPQNFRIGGAGDVRGRVPTEMLRGVVERSGMPMTTVSLAAGYTESTVRKALKMDTMTAMMAVRVLRALDVAPAEVGL